MAGLKFAPKAERDLNEIWDWIARDNPRAAVDFAAGVERTCRPLADNPGMGRRRDELRRGLRSFPHGKYLILYRPVRGGVEIARILLGARDIAALFRSTDRPRGTTTR